MSRRFFQFRLSQLLLLFVLVSILCALGASFLHQTYSKFALDRAVRRYKQGQKDLKQAVIKNDIDLAKRALSSGFTAQQLIAGQNPLLHMSVMNGQIEIVELLLESGADANKSERIPMLPTTARPQKERNYIFDGPPLLVAVGSPQSVATRKEMIRLLLKHVPDSEVKSRLAYAMDRVLLYEDAEATDILREFGGSYGPREMAVINRLDELKREVAKNPEIVKRRYELYGARPGHGPTLLGISLNRGYREMSLFLIDAGAPLDVLERFGESLLHVAARGGDVEPVRVLIARGLDVNARDDMQTCPIHLAASGGHSAAVEALIAAGADVRHRDKYESSALYLAAVSNHPELFKTLLDAGADADEACRRLLADANQPNIAPGYQVTLTKRAELIEDLSGELK